MLTFNLVSIFPDFFTSPLSVGLLQKAMKRGSIAVQRINPRDFTEDIHHRVDDRPFGGGPGMVMQLQPILDAIATLPSAGRILLMSPAGKQLSTQLAKELAKEETITIICGRYEGIDARLDNFLPIEEVAVGYGVLNGGETAALAVIESVSRFLPGFMGKQESLEEETFSMGLLEYPQYTRPEIFRGKSTPEVLLSGNHREIEKWRRKAAILKTLAAAPELLDETNLSAADLECLKKERILRPGRNISFCLLHHPVWLGDGVCGTSSLTNLDIHDISRISLAYGMGPFFIFTPLADQLEVLNKLVGHWLDGAGRDSNPDRSRALSLAAPVNSFEELETAAESYYGVPPKYIITSAAWPRKSSPLSFRQVLQESMEQPVIICLGTARGLNANLLPFCFEQLRPVRFLSDNHLPVRAAAAIIADRILGDYH